VTNSARKFGEDQNELAGLDRALKEKAPVMGQKKTPGFPGVGSGVWHPNRDQ